MIVTMKTNVFENVDEKILLLAITGTLEALKKGAITIDESEKFLFSPHMIKILKEKKCDEKIVGIIEKGCELEDISSLLPEKLEEVIEELKQETIMYTNNYEEYNKMFWLEV
ncbi:MAG: DUF3969 family protein [Lachnospiraceae bacterium]|nr:DUF3969 family protein [Lachnospiraceae bacterium]